MLDYQLTAEPTRTCFTAQEVQDLLAESSFIAEVLRMGAYTLAYLRAHGVETPEESLLILRLNGHSIVPAFQFVSEGGKLKLRLFAQLINATLQAYDGPWEAVDFWMSDHPALVGLPELDDLGLPPWPLSLLALEGKKVTVPTGHGSGTEQTAATTMLLQLAAQTPDK